MAHSVASVKLPQAFQGDLQAEVSFEHHAPLLQIVAAPALQQVPVQHAAAEVIADLVARVVVAIVDPLID